MRGNTKYSKLTFFVQTCWHFVDFIKNEQFQSIGSHCCEPNLEVDGGKCQIDLHLQIFSKG